MIVPYSNLPRRAVLVPTQSSYAFLARQVRQMHYYDQPSLFSSLLEKLWRKIGHRDSLENPRLVQTYTALSELTRVSPSDYYSATLHRFFPALHLPQQPMESIILEGQSVPLLNSMQRRGHFLPQNSAQACPKCLKESRFHRLGWLPVSVTVCLKHNCLLMDRCPDCSSLLTIDAVDQAICAVCSADLTLVEHQTIPLSSTDISSQCFVQSLLDLPKGIRPTNTKLPDDLAPSVQYRLLDGLQRSIRLRSQSFIATEIPTEPNVPLLVEQRHRIYTAAYMALIDWPDSFYGFLDAYSEPELQTSNSNADFGLGFLYLGWIENAWQQPEFHFVQDAFDKYMTSRFSTLHSLRTTRRVRRNPSLAKDVPYLTLSEAAQMLGIALDSLRKLVKRGVINDYEAIENDKRLVRRTDIEALLKRWEESIPLAEAVEILGVSDDIVLALATSGALITNRGPLVDGSAQWFISGKSILDFRRRVISHVHTFDPNRKDHDVSLETASRIGSVVGLNAAAILRRVADGTLNAYIDKDFPITDLRRLRLYSDDISTTIQDIRRENGWLSKSEVASIFAVKDTIISRWQARGLLNVAVTIGSANYFSEFDVNQFSQSHIFTEQAAEILQVGKLVVQKWVRSGRLHPVSGPGVDECHRYLFRRDEIESLRPENRLTAPQLARRLGISRSQLSEWIKQGKVRPISGPSVDGSKHYIFLLDMHNTPT